jgi:protein O-mannosyl-transferase
MATTRKERVTHLFPVIGLILLSLAVFGQTLGYDFISNWDDNLYVTQNPDIRGFSFQNLGHIFSTSYVGNYAPVQMLSYLLDYQLAGLNPGWFHGVNVALQTLNGLLFYFLVRRFTGKTLWAFAAAGVFLLHPVQVESVAWISQRKNLLAMFFSLLSFHCYLSYRERSGNEGMRAYFLSLFFLFAALLAKPIAVVMPVAYFCYDLYLESPRPGKPRWAEKIPFFAAAALAAGCTYFTQTLVKDAGSFDFFAGDPVAKILTMLPVLTRYLKLLVWPVDLNLIYIFIVKHHVDASVVLALVLVALLCLVGGYLLRRDRRLFFGFALFFLGLVPVSQIVPLVTLMNDRYLYFPMLGAAWIVGGVLSRLHDRFPGSKVSPAVVLILVVLAPLGLLSYQRAAVWQNPITLWSDVSGKLPGLKDPRASLAESYLDAGQKENALRTYQETFAMKREFSEPAIEQKALSDTAELYLEAGFPAKALPMLTTVTAKYPDYAAGFAVLGEYYYRNRDLPRAEAALHRAVELEPLSVQALELLGTICLETGRGSEAQSWKLKAKSALAPQGR